MSWEEKEEKKYEATAKEGEGEKKKLTSLMTPDQHANGKKGILVLSTSFLMLTKTSLHVSANNKDKTLDLTMRSPQIH